MNKALNLLLVLLLCISCDEKKYQIGSGLIVSHSEPASSQNISAWVIQDSTGTILINAFVLSIDFDNKFVIVEQEPKELLWSDSMCYIYSIEDYYSMVDTSTLRHYWIIDKSKERVFYDNCDSVPGVYGPFSKQLFNTKRKMLGVSDSLVFQNVVTSKRYRQYRLD